MCDVGIVVLRIYKCSLESHGQMHCHCSLERGADVRDKLSTRAPCGGTRTVALPTGEPLCICVTCSASVGQCYAYSVCHHQARCNQKEPSHMPLYASNVVS